MKYTLSQMVERLDIAKAFPVDASLEEKKSLTNEGLEAAILSGRWNGTKATITIFVTTTGLMTLPREFLTCDAIKVDGIVRDMASPWYQFLGGTSDISQWSTNIQDMGDGFCVFKQPTEAAKLRFVCEDDSTSVVEVHGQDADGNEIYTGSSSTTKRGVVLTFNAVKAAPYFTTVSELIKPQTTSRGYLYACYDDSTEEVIGIYAPGETVPSLRQYLVQEATVKPDGGTSTILAYVQRRHVDLTDNDICPISNLRAMKNLVRHIHFENESDESRSAKALDNAIMYLNMELKILRAPGEKGGVRVDATCAGAQGLKSKR